jgi:Uma2 family endonuclease
MGEPAKRLATYEDILALPPDCMGQVVDGQLHVQPRPALPHAGAASILGEELGPPFRRGRGGPGGWLILHEPELHLGADILVPDLAGWHRDRVPAEMLAAPYAIVAPDWVCEVLSASTQRIDRGTKRVAYARENVTHLWFIDPEAKSLEILRLDGTTYRIVDTFFEDAKVRAEPFEAIELDLGLVWRP